MAQCTAPREGHRTASGRANCPACGGSYGRNYGGYGGSSYTPPRVYAAPTPPRRVASYASRSSGGGSRSSSSQSRRSAVTYSTREYETLNPIREQAVRIAQTHEDRRDLFLCHAWDDRQGVALDFYDLLIDLDVKVWFSEKDVPLGTPLMRQIDKGLKNSRMGMVLVTPALLRSLDSEGIADKELSVLLNSGRVVPILHGVTFEELNDVSPMLASHTGLATADYLSLAEVATKLADTAIIDELAA